MPVALARPSTEPPTLEDLANAPARVAELEPGACAAMAVRCAAVLAALGARLNETAAKPVYALQPPMDLDTAAPLLGMSADTLRRRMKHDPAFRALVFDNGTDRLLFDPGKVEAFRRRRTG
jgi:hypothetical protein